MLPPQDLCTGCFLCQQLFPLDILMAHSLNPFQSYLLREANENAKLLPSGQFLNPLPAFFPTGIILYLITLRMFSPSCLLCAFPPP